MTVIELVSDLNSILKCCMLLRACCGMTAGHVVLVESIETQLPYSTEVLLHGEVKVPLRTIETSQTLLVRRFD